MDEQESLDADALPAVGSDNKTKRRHHRKPRPKLSCSECRNKKLSCDRRMPCQRCIKSGRADSCTFASAIWPTLPSAPDGLHPKIAALNGLSTDISSQIRELQSEVAVLKTQLATSCAASSGRQSGHDTANTSSNLVLIEDTRDPGTVDSGQTLLPSVQPVYSQGQRLDYLLSTGTQKHDPEEPCSRPAQGYYRQHSLFRFFAEIPQLFPLIKETANEHFRPRHIALRKAKLTTSPDVFQLKALLPPNEDTKHLLLAYLDDFENVHRVVDRGVFRPWSIDDYVAQLQGQANDSTVALVLAIISLSVTLNSFEAASPGSMSALGRQSPYKQMLPTWVSACEVWLGLRTSKRRGLEYYQVSCLIYLVKRMNGIKKKRFWIETGALVQEAVMDRLHLEPPKSDGDYEQEMKRRIWSSIRELDLQNSFEFGLPTILHSLESDVAPPSDVQDEEINNDPDNNQTGAGSSYRYTLTSYQHLAARSWRLRLDISRSLYGTGTNKSLSNEDILRYTDEVYRAIDALPSQGVHKAEGNAADKSSRETFMLSKAFLICQLKHCILTLHRHRIQRGGADFSSLSEILCYTTSKDILSLHKELSEAGLRTLTLLREDILTASLTITRISLQQPPGQGLSSFLSTGAATTDTSALTLLEQCLPIIEERFLRCFHGEPWCPLTMLGAIMLLKMHSGKETRQTAKAATAQRFLDLYYKHLLEQEASYSCDDPGFDLTLPFESLVDMELCESDLDWAGMVTI